MRNIKNIVQHELIGLECEVVKAKNKNAIGISGRITDETLKTMVINNKRVFKKGTLFCLNLEGKKVYIEGDFLATRPEDRIKKRITRW
ncbi:MAG: ribonuclease P protein subunit [Candidatus Aenigmarchaeota archaeon]|nr:ribonuclease P protein subunit [Candidatus Aenigmarchaeota archaeon]